MTVDSDTAGTVQTFHLRTYNDEEFRRALEICRESRLLIAAEEPVPPAAVPAQATVCENPFGNPPGFRQNSLTRAG